MIEIIQLIYSCAWQQSNKANYRKALKTAVQDQEITLKKQKRNMVQMYNMTPTEQGHGKARRKSNYM